MIKGDARGVRILALASLSILILGQLYGIADAVLQQEIDSRAQKAHVIIPRVDRTPRLEDFLEMRQMEDWKGKLVRLNGFIQRAPDDGRIATQNTEVYLGYDTTSLYIVFVAFDTEPGKIRARLSPREGFRFDEDQVGFYLDTFHDQRRAYQFSCNALGIQSDDLYTEDTQVVDSSFDTVWQSDGKITPEGFVVWTSIPFKSLRFKPTTSQEWGIMIWRWLPRRLEGSWWPQATFKVRSLLSQEATVGGLQNISPSRNYQFIPYGTWRAYRVPDLRDSAHPFYSSDNADFKGGLDSKVILKDSLVLDLTLNPDFAQVESDEPQTVINQRFEVFFPEKRPFFTENSNYFDIPTTEPNRALLFTRRIADPEFGARLTGKLGPYSIGTLIADDRSPGTVIPFGDPLEGKRAVFDIFRLSRDLPRQSNVGVIFTEKHFQGSSGRLLAFDSNVKLNETWSTTFLAATSWSQNLEGSNTSGSNFEAGLLRSGRSFNYVLSYLNRSPNFRTDVGFINRTDIRRFYNNLFYRHWAGNKYLSNVTPELTLEYLWDHKGTSLERRIRSTLSFELNQPTSFSFWYEFRTDVLSNEDYPILNQNQSYRQNSRGFSASSSYFRFLTLDGTFLSGTQPNFIPLAGQTPLLTDFVHLELNVSFRYSMGLTIDNTYLFDRNRSRELSANAFDSRTIRSKWNWQLTRLLSVRFIGQYDVLIANPLLTSAKTNRNLNADFLITYLVHPGTAIYLGYNGNLRKPGPPIGGDEIDSFVNDARQFFVKVSYLYRL